jgi:hypothetical protein
VQFLYTLIKTSAVVVLEVVTLILMIQNYIRAPGSRLYSGLRRVDIEEYHIICRAGISLYCY